MITFVIVLTVWMGATPHTFGVTTKQRFGSTEACAVVMDSYVEQIRTKANHLKKHPRFQIERGCFMQTGRDI